MKRYLKPTLIISALTLLSQFISFLIQVLIARHFGAKSAADAYWIGITFPQYVTTIVVHSIGLVFLPVFVEYFEKEDPDGAWTMAYGLMAWISVLLGVVCALGFWFAPHILQWTAPGIPSESLPVAVIVARWSWVAVLPGAWSNILSSVYQARHSFRWQGVVPFLGSLVQIGLLKFLLPLYGVYAIAISTTVSLFLQWLLLMPVLWEHRRLIRWKLWSHPGVHEVGRLLIPLILSNLIIRWTPVVDRYFASHLAEGSIAHLGYASRIFGVISVLISVGLTTVVFPMFAARSARQDKVGLLAALSLSLRVLWMMVAPAIAIGGALAIPLLSFLFQRGAFQWEDSRAVGQLLQVYLLALGAACLGNVTSRMFYALKKTKLIAAVGPVESLAYAVYAYFFSKQYGVQGLAWSYVFYFNLSLIGHIIVLRVMLGPLGSLAILKSMARVTCAALAGGAAAYFIYHGTPVRWIQLFVGGTVGSLLYISLLHLFKAPEWRLLWDTLSSSDPQYIPQKQNSL